MGEAPLLTLLVVELFKIGDWYRLPELFLLTDPVAGDAFLPGGV
jgi:hypothetical protein